MQHSKGKSVLIFCSTRKGAQEAAQCLSQIAASLGYSNPFIKSKQQQDKLKEASLTCSDKQMQSCILYGGKLCYKPSTLNIKWIVLCCFLICWLAMFFHLIGCPLRECLFICFLTVLLIPFIVILISQLVIIMVAFL